MVVNFGKLKATVTDLVRDYQEGIRRRGEFPGVLEYKDSSKNYPSWWNDLFRVLDEELDHREEAICDTVEGKVDYLGPIGHPFWLGLRHYIAVIRSTDGNIVIDYTTSDVQDPSARIVRLTVGNTVYLVRNFSDSIIDYSCELLA